jgi:hypothetical protein
MKARIFLMLFIAVALPKAALADSPAQAFGFGNSSCADFAKAYAKNPAGAETLYFVWAQGFITGINLAAILDHKPYHTMEPGEAAMKDYMASIRAYCNAHPLASYALAVADLYGTLPVVRGNSN